ncbi:glycosyl hydrolase, family 1 [Dictyocaulus viviparus]|uniref:Glycosyl hydrolase, family 1 n=1 Tax=Dictyocaulus viviparus TaxID=29172 RepID=A0A0D8XJC6_DICVI|nr:glycosyl hydrolase, family 1 [Dictyocaulus viviparus]
MKYLVEIEDDSQVLERQQKQIDNFYGDASISVVGEHKGSISMSYACLHNVIVVFVLMLCKHIRLLILAILSDLTAAVCVPKSHLEQYGFPSGFRWAVATAAFQIEGATKEDGRGPSIWDEYQTKPGKISDNSTADVTSDSYHKFHDDVKLMKSLGVSYYRFSLSWSRILPTGDISTPNRKGIHYYHALIDTLIENKIVPMVTLYHWDLPLALQDVGGWLNRKIVKWFRLYAVFCFREFGDKVKHWITLNEPHAQAHVGYCGIGEEHAPGGFQDHCSWTQYLAGHHMLLAHAHAYCAYHNLFNDSKGKIGISNSENWAEPESKIESDFAQEVRQWFAGWFIHPIFEGDYPPAMRQTVDKNSIAEGRASSRLPHFSDHERKLLVAPHLMLGLDCLH